MLELSWNPSGAILVQKWRSRVGDVQILQNWAVIVYLNVWAFLHPFTKFAPRLREITILGCLGGIFGASWSHLGAILGSSRGHLGKMVPSTSATPFSVVPVVHPSLHRK